MDGLPRWLSGKVSACQAGDPGSIPELGKSLEEGMTWQPTLVFLDRGAWEAIVHGVTKS